MTLEEILYAMLEEHDDHTDLESLVYEYARQIRELEEERPA